MNLPSRSASIVLVAGVLSLATAQDEAKADRIWKKALDAADAGAFDLSRGMMQAFAKAYPRDSRAEEANQRAAGNAFLSRVPWCVNGARENRIDIGMSADGLLGTQEDQDKLRAIVTNTYEAAMLLHPFDTYWPYFNWHIVHAGSRKRGLNPRAPKDEYDTCFGGMAGWKNGTDADAAYDFDLVRKTFHPRHIPDIDLFLVHVRAGNGWAMDPFIAIGTAHFRYVPRVLGDGRLRDGEICGNDLPFPILKERFAARWAAFQLKLAKERVPLRDLSIRDWRRMTAGMKLLPYESGTSGQWRVAANEVSDRRPYPDPLIQDRPFPEFESLPWYPWLLKGDPTVTCKPTMMNNFQYTTVRDFVLKPNGELDLVYQPNNQDQKAKIMKEYGGRLPNDKEIRERTFLGYFSHEKCFLGGCDGPQNMSPQCCAACLEQAVLGIYRRVNPIDEAVPAEKELQGTKFKFGVHVLKPLDHFLTVEWRVDGKVVTAGTERTLVARGKTLGGLPPYKPQKKTKAYFYPEDAEKAAPALSASVLGQKDIRARHVFNADNLPPGEHVVEVTVIDETPLVIRDPEELLTRRQEWKVTVPEK